MSNEHKPRWVGTAPPTCELCGEPLTDAFVDGATARGWASMDTNCHRIFGRGLGSGLGQRYERQDDGHWVKVAG